MDIRDIQSTGASQPTQGSRGTGSSKPSQGSGASGDRDRVTVSARAQAIHSARQAALAMPEVRTDRVQEIRERLAQGEIVPDPSRIARALLDQGVV